MSRTRGAWPFCLAFLVVTAAVWQGGGTNPDSRFATLRAMVHHGTFRIDRFRHWTTDVAHAPDGSAYSNKAPGPVLLAYPLAWALRQLGVDVGRDDRRPPRRRYKIAFSLILQAVPFALAVWMADRVLERRRASLAGRRYAALAALFGNTVVLFMGTFFGHGVAAWCLLGSATALLAERHAAAGALCGLAALSDYAVALLAPLILLSPLVGPGRRARAVAAVALGGAVPAAVFALYHLACFGSPFVIALHHQRPRFAAVKAEGSGVGRVLSPRPDPEALRELSVGGSRGILFTQPWVYVVYAAVLALLLRRRPSIPAPLSAVALIGLPLLLYLNAGFRGWHGGWSAGPRYLSPIFPVFALLAGCVYDGLGRAWRALLWATLLPAIALRALIYSGDDFLFRGLGGLWPSYFGELRGDVFGPHGLRLAVFAAALAAAALATLRQTPRPAAALTG